VPQLKLRVPGAREPLLAKVPEITVLFWIIKVLTTGMGEACSDFLANTSIVAGIGLALLAFVGALWLQLRTRRYAAPVYWFTVAMVAVFGTMAADGVHLAGLPYAVSTTFYALVVTGLFVFWYRSEGTLSIHSITTHRRELFYWATVFATFALGTAAGDLAADSLHLGFLNAGIVFAVAMLVPLIGWWRFQLNPGIAFWAAYVLTRPLGASFADWFGKPHSFGAGLGYGDGTVTAVTAVVIGVLVLYVSIRRNDIQPADAQTRRHIDTSATMETSGSGAHQG
jgi:uncharacterized membrane-anchored protein